MSDGIESACQLAATRRRNFHRATRPADSQGRAGWIPSAANQRHQVRVSFSLDLQHGQTILFIVEGGDDRQVGRLNSALSIRGSALRQSVLVYRAAA